MMTNAQQSFMSPRPFLIKRHYHLDIPKKTPLLMLQRKFKQKRRKSLVFPVIFERPLHSTYITPGTQPGQGGRPSNESSTQRSTTKRRKSTPHL